MFPRRLFLWCCIACAASAFSARAQEGGTSAWARLTLRGMALDVATLGEIPLPQTAARTPVEKELERAAEAIRGQDLTAASSALREVVRLDPENQSARFVAASAFIQAGRHREARDLLEDLLRRRPSDYPLMNNLAWLLATAGDASVRDAGRAVKLAQDAVLLAPSDYHVWSTLAEAHYVKGDYDRALRAVRETLRLAQMAKAAPAQVEGYEKQREKCERAVRAFSLLE